MVASSPVGVNASSPAWCCVGLPVVDARLAPPGRLRCRADRADPHPPRRITAGMQGPGGTVVQILGPGEADPKQLGFVDTWCSPELGGRPEVRGQPAGRGRSASGCEGLPVVLVIADGTGAYVVVLRLPTDMRFRALVGRAAECAAINEVLAAAAAGP